MVQWFRGREVYVLIGTAAGDGIMPLIRAEAGEGFLYLPALSCWTTSAGADKTSKAEAAGTVFLNASDVTFLNC